MCHVTGLHCVVCETDGSYLFAFCENVKQNKWFGKVAPTGERIYCPDFVWPPEHWIQSQHICDGCLKKGVEWYAKARQRAELELAARKAYEAKNNSRSSFQVNSEKKPEEKSEENPKENSEENSEESSEEGSHEKDSSALHLVRDGFHESWNNIKPHIKLQVIRTYDSIKPEDFDLYWECRVEDATYRTLRLYVPFCKVCRTASLDEQGGIDGVEMEPEPILWKWMARLQNECAIETHLSTDFMMKPCVRCANNEIRLRAEVSGFLNSCSNQQAWALWRCLQRRGRGETSFWRLKDMDTSGHPDTKPRSTWAFLNLMRQGWEDKAGSSWENWVDLASAPTYKFPVIHFPEPFLALTQWRRFGDLGILDMPKDIEIKPPAPELMRDNAPTKKDPNATINGTGNVYRDYVVIDISPNGVKIDWKDWNRRRDAGELHHQREGASGSSSASQGTSVETNNNNNNGGEVLAEDWEDIVQDDDDLFGDNMADELGHDVAAHEANKDALANGHGPEPPDEDHEMTDIGMGEAAATQGGDAGPEKRNGRKVRSSLAGPGSREKKRVRFKEADAKS